MEALQSAPRPLWMNTPAAAQTGMPQDRPGRVRPRLASLKAAAEHWCGSRRRGAIHGRIDRGHDGAEGGAGGVDLKAAKEDCCGTSPESDHYRSSSYIYIYTTTTLLVT